MLLNLVLTPKNKTVSYKTVFTPTNELEDELLSEYGKGKWKKGDIIIEKRNNWLTVVISDELACDMLMERAKKEKFEDWKDILKYIYAIV